MISSSRTVPSRLITFTSRNGNDNESEREVGLTPHSIRYASYPSEFDLVGRSPPQPLRGVRNE